MNEETIRKLTQKLQNISFSKNSEATKTIAKLLLNALPYFEKNLMSSRTKATNATIFIVEDKYATAIFMNEKGKEYKIQYFYSFYRKPFSTDDFKKSFTELPRLLIGYGNFIKFNAENLTITIG